MVTARRATHMTLGAVSFEEHLGEQTRVAVLHCVDPQGERLTAFGDGEHLRRLLASGEASDPAGMTLPAESFPVILRGWLG